MAKLKVTRILKHVPSAAISRKSKRIRDAKKNYKLDIKREWVMNGKCWFCGEPVYNHSKLCKEYYVKSLVYAKKSKEARIKNEQARTAKISAANDESSRK